MKEKREWKDSIIIFVGTVLMAISFNMIYEPIGMVTGGFAGLAIVVKAQTAGWMEGGLPLWVTTTILNIPLFILSYFILGKEFVKRTLYGAVCFSAALYLIPSEALFGEDLLLTTIFGALLMGVGMGLIFMTSSSTGGTDMLGTLVQHFMPQYSVPFILAILDGCIVLIGAVVFGINRAMYAVIAVYITAKVTDSILEGMKFAKSVYIISAQEEMIAKDIMQGIRHGVTRIPVQGMYTQKEKYMLLCVVGKKEIPWLKETVRKRDPKAFVIVSDAREVMGEFHRSPVIGKMSLHNTQK